MTDQQKKPNCYDCGDQCATCAQEIERLNDELISVEQLAKDRYCKMQSEIERLQMLLNDAGGTLADRCERLDKAPPCS